MLKKVLFQPVFPFLVLLSLLSSGVLFSAKCFSKPESVQDLRYGVVLYHFYQQSYFNALTELMAAQQLAELPNHAENAELLQGGMSLSYGLDGMAEDIFTRILSEPVEGIDRTTAWFYLAKLEYQRGDTERAKSALEKIEGQTSGILAEQADYMKARILLASGDVDAANQRIAQLPITSVWLPYYYYNLGVVETARGDWQAGINAFKQLQQLPITNTEEKALRDRAYTASGFAYMAGGELDKARKDFSQVRIDSPLVDRALLGYGWAAAQQNDYQAALSPWRQLSEHSLLYPSVQESLLAIPYAYETLGSPVNALHEYQKAVQLYQREISRIDSAITVFNTDNLDQLFDFSALDIDEWLVGGEILPINEQAPYLAQLIASHKFQQAIKNLRDLTRMARYLQQASQRLEVLTAVDLEQQQLWQAVISDTELQSFQRRQAALLATRTELAAELAEAVSENTGERLASEEQKSLAALLNRAEKRLDRLGAVGEEVIGQRARIGLYRGMLAWDNNESYADGIWQHKKQLKEVVELNEQSQLALQQVEQAIGNRQQSAFTPRIKMTADRVARYQSRVNTTLAASELNIRSLAIAELENQQRRLTHYLAQAKLAIARLYDRGSIEVIQ